MPLWNVFKDSIAADHILALGDHIVGYDRTLQMIDDHLSHQGKHLSDYGLLTARRRSLEVFNKELYLHRNEAMFHTESENMYDRLNPEQ